ncbi:MAG TPA: 3-hydroxyacyl-CoA dehydrogenase family protein [Candidatus Alectryocaccobium stercorigallinarum]|nr:3-hydroxyacyl-CoA dehydrogenase family protein [Candidatus Alectryocaccobium stercorigallinarum]
MINEKIAVYGSGTIGACEATLITGNGFECTVIGHSEKGLKRCKRTFEQNWDDLIEKGYASKENKAAALKLLTITNKPEQLDGCTFVFEAASEDVSVKKEVYENICKYADESAIIASCTSSLDASVLASLTDRPEQLIIAHPFQPAHMLPLVEVVPNAKTSKQTVSRTMEVLNVLHRQTVYLNKSVPGFLVNRLAQALFRECIYLIEQGVTTAADIDKAVKYAVGMRYASIGLMEYFDDVGFELEKAIAENIYPDLCGTKEIQSTVLNGIASGNNGRAGEQGFYDWTKIDQDDYRVRKQAPFFDSVKEWTMPV